ALEVNRLDDVMRGLAALLDPLSAALHNIADQVSEAFPLALLEKITRDRSRWLPENLRHLRPAMWDWLFRVSVKDGVCLGWAPRSSIIDDLLKLKSTGERHQLLIDRREDVVDDVLHSLSEVEHPKLTTYVNFATEAAACIRQGQDAAAQALLGNVVDSALRVHGRAWIQDHFGALSSSEDTPHKLVRGVLARQSRAVISGRTTMVGPYLLVTSLKNVFDGPQERQSTFNRNLTAHHVREDTYRRQFALTALLVVQGLLRQLDGFLCSDPDLTDDEEADGGEWAVVLNQAIAVLSALSHTASQETFAVAVKADSEGYKAKRDQVMSAYHGLRRNLPVVYGPAPSCENCGADCVSGPAEAKCGKPGSFWWCEVCTAKRGDRKPL
ncbi:hypothetical protein, partial [Streptomyces sp. IB201691-2A2]|uniref:hypothetical protein n=1 Tax=Streptomyces sp. IB201691-2A2 TaxID=2561920 RepID=UPI00163D8548